GTLARCTESTETLRTVSVAGDVRGTSLEQPLSPPARATARGTRRERMELLRVMASPQEIEGSRFRWPTPGWRSWYESDKQLPSSRSGCGASLLRRPASR